MRDPIAFIHETDFDSLPADVVHMAKRVLLDTLGVAITGRQTELADIVYHHAAVAYGGQAAKLWLDGRYVSLPGAVLAHATACDAVDMHDGFQLTKGHAGAALIPAALALLKPGTSGRELLTMLAVGYEIAIRAGVTLHATVTDYHTSGAWNTLGCAAMYARSRQLTYDQTRHALGIAEYNGPRSQMMRCIDYPTMLKDGTGWGAMAGISAGMLAESGFTGAPAITVEPLGSKVERDEVNKQWGNLGQAWLILGQYFKQYAVCYWAQPAVAAALTLKERHQIDPADIRRIEVHTFHEASRLAMREPRSTEEAQYSLPFPVGAALVHGQLTARELQADQLKHPDVLRLSNLVEMFEVDAYNEIFPSDRFCHLTVETADGQTVHSERTRPPWTEKEPPSDNLLDTKFKQIASQTLPQEKVNRLSALIWHTDELDDASEILELLQR